MKRMGVSAVLLLFGLLAAPAGAVETTFDHLVVGQTEDFKQTTAPAVSATGRVRIYYDSGTHTLKCSYEGAAYADCIAASATPGAPDTAIQFNQASTFGGSADLTWDYTNKRLRATNLTESTDGTLPFVFFSGTLPASPSATATGFYLSTTSAGSQTEVQRGTSIGLAAGYTGPNETDALVTQNSAASTGAGGTTGLVTNGFGNFPVAGEAGSAGIFTLADAAGSGERFGAFGEARGGTDGTVGLFGKAADAVAGTHIGVLGSAGNSTEATNYKNVGGWFSLSNTDPMSLVNNVSVALLAQGNGGNEFMALNEGTVNLTIDSTGGINMSGNLQTAGTVISTRASTIGWTLQSAANQACETTCTDACVVGQDTGTKSLVDCSDATADVCLCAGPS